MTLADIYMNLKDHNAG